jgi:hypothetical protein
LKNKNNEKVSSEIDKILCETKEVLTLEREREDKNSFEAIKALVLHLSIIKSFSSLHEHRKKAAALAIM